jgi:hypothetical protein
VCEIRKHHHPAVKEKKVADAISDHLAKAKMSSKYGVSEPEISKRKANWMDNVVDFFHEKEFGKRRPTSTI